MSELRIESAQGFWNQPVRILRDALPREAIDGPKYVRQVVMDPNFDPSGAFLARDSQGYVGFCLALAPTLPVENAPLNFERGYVTLLGTAVQARGQGIGSTLLAKAEEFLRSRGRTEAWISPYPYGYFTPGVDVEAYADGLRFFLERGYREVYRPLAMERSLWDYEMPAWVEELSQSQKPAIWYDGHHLSTSRAYDLLRFVSEVFPGDWVRVVREAIKDILDGDRPDRLQVAVEVSRQEPTRVVGFSHYRAERFGPIGVHPDHRGRGIGHVLTHATLRAQQHAGYRTSWFLWTDDRTADRIYKPAGFREVRRFAVLKKDL